MDSESRNNNLERLTNMGYDLVTAQKYLTICDNNLNKTIELLLSDNSIKDEINVDISKLTSVVTGDTKYESDRSNKIIKMLEKLSDNREEIINALEQSNGNFEHAKMILNKGVLSDTDTDSDTD
jgi:hypothetical protein